MLLIFNMRRVFRFGTVALIDAAGTRHQICSFGKPTVVLRLTDKKVARRLVLASSIGWCEAYMDGRLKFEEGGLSDFLQAYGLSQNILEQTWLGELFRILYSIVASVQHYNPMGRARRNVAHHYDLSAELYDQFLDSDRQYSCAYFPRGDEDIETAQLLKKRHIAAKLNIKPGMTVLDIGSGWGGMGIYLAQNFDCRITGVTLSKEQYNLSNRRVRALGLEHRVKFELRDYRSLTEPVDRIVSVGMLEHVGQFQYREYFKKVKALLKPDGVALIHTIARMGKPRPIGAWIRKYIFPGAYLPSPSQLTSAIDHSYLWLTDVENLRIHYAKTLRCWYERFALRRDKIVRLYDERFYRMWEMYLLGCEVAFKDQYITVLQLQITREKEALPLTRDYMISAEKALALRDANPGPVKEREEPLSESA
ncbi:MAG: cyclopropane-fatty-acyl-phospholipid synthase family protein [Gammaproteobacteria bacterium]|nr:cyclopropane-fatty-acyl-phospholipid synthase family protein [Gammaproteobacteria bacterium]